MCVDNRYVRNVRIYEPLSLYNRENGAFAKGIGLRAIFFELKTNSRYKWKIKKGAGSH